MLDYKFLFSYLQLCHIKRDHPVRPVESRSGARETIIAGPYHNIILICRDRDAQCVEREETWGGVSPHHLTMGLGKRRKLTHGVPAEN